MAQAGQMLRTISQTILQRARAKDTALQDLETPAGAKNEAVPPAVPAPPWVHSFALVVTD